MVDKLLQIFWYPSEETEICAYKPAGLERYLETFLGTDRWEQQKKEGKISLGSLERQKKILKDKALETTHILVSGCTRGTSTEN